MLNSETHKPSKPSSGRKTANPRLHRDTVYIPVRNLSVVWVRAQRPFDEAWASLIAENFDKDLFEDVIVTKPNKNGISHIIEGQHRVAAVAILWGPDELVPCRVVADADPQRAAEIWSLINDAKKRARPVDHFHVLVEAGNDEAVQIEQILKRHGLMVGTRQRGAVACVKSLRSVYRLKATKEQSVGVLLSLVIKMMVGIWGPNNADAYPATLVTAFGQLAKTYWADLDATRLIETIKKRFFNPDELLAAGRHNRERTLSRGVCRELVFTYNYKKAGGRLSLDML